MDFLGGFIFINIPEQIADFRFIIPLNSKKVLEIAQTTAKSNSAGNCIFQYPTGFSQSSTLLLCVKYINNNLRPIIKNGETELWGGSIEAKNLNVQEGTEVTAFLAKII